MGSNSSAANDGIFEYHGLWFVIADETDDRGQLPTDPAPPGREEFAMTGIDNVVDQVFQEWDEQKIKLNSPAFDQNDKLGSWAPLIAQRARIFTERWRPDRIRLMKRLGNQTNANPDAVRGQLTPLAREEFLSDLRSYGVPDRYAHAGIAMLDITKR